MAKKDCMLQVREIFQERTTYPRTPTTHLLTAVNPLLLGKKVGRQTGFEPATPGTTNQCSNQLSYYRHKRKQEIKNML